MKSFVWRVLKSQSCSNRKTREMRKGECLRVYVNSSATCEPSVNIYTCTYSIVVTPPCSSMHFELWFNMFSWLTKIGAVHLSDLCTASAWRVFAQLLFTFLHFVCGFHFIHVENSTQFKFDLEISGTQSEQYFFLYIIIVWSYGSRGLDYILFAFPLWQNAIEPIRFRFETLPTRKTQFFSRKGKKNENNWFIRQNDAIPSKVRKKTRIACFLLRAVWHICKSSIFRLNLSLPFWNVTKMHQFIYSDTFSFICFSRYQLPQKTYSRTAWACDILFKEFKSNGKKGIMSDEMDECACYWSHEFAMRRLLALVSIGIWIFAWFGGCRKI